MHVLIVYTWISLFTTWVWAQLTPWDNRLFNFGWEPYEPTIERCSTIPIRWGDRDTANPPSVGPYTITALYGGLVPIEIATVEGNGYDWIVELPAGGPYIITITDANGYSGGNSLVFNVQSPPTGSCGTVETTSNTLRLTSSGEIAQCSVITLTAQGGTAPYTMKVHIAQRPPKTTTWTTSTMGYVVDVQPSEQFFVIVEDANGNIAVDGIHTVGTGDSSCYNVATTVSSGVLPTTLSYDPSYSETWSRTSSDSQSDRLSTTHSIISNTESQTVVSTVTLPNGGLETYTLAPGASVTVPAEIANTTKEKKTNLPAIVGGVAGGVALIALVLILLFIRWRRAAQRKHLQGKQEIYNRRHLTGTGLPPSATQIVPFTGGSGAVPSRYDVVPLMTHNSLDSTTRPPFDPLISSPSYSGSGNEAITTVAPWPNPEPNPRQAPPVRPSHPLYLATASPSTSISTLPNDIPPGAMPPQIGKRAVPGPGMRQSSTPTAPEKATYNPIRQAVVAPPPYPPS